MKSPEELAIYARAKAELRKRLRGLRATTPASACAARSEKIVTALLAHPALASARRVASFWPMMERHEVDLRALDEALRARQVELAYPAIDPETREMHFRVTASRDDLEERGFGFEEPAPSAPLAGALDLIIVPALAVAPTGHRLGYGAGFYDRTLPRFAPPATTLAVAYDFQLLVEVPAVDTDVAVDWIVTDRRVFQAEKPG